MPAYNPLIIALDTPSSLKALHLVSKLKVSGVAFKVGFELFLSAGPKIIEKIMNHEARVFLDLKFHDIPNTVSRAAREATRRGVWMFNVHASGGLEMMRAAKEASLDEARTRNLPPPIVLGVTVLTSMDSLKDQNVSLPIPEQVIHLAQLAKKAGLDGVVSSAQEARMIRKAIGDDFCIVTPGIRPQGHTGDDQKRIVSADQAMKEGSSYLVVGRPVTEAPMPMRAVDQILSSLQ